MNSRKKFVYLVHYKDEKKLEVFLKLLKMAGQNFFMARTDGGSQIMVMFMEDQRANIEVIDGVTKVEEKPNYSLDQYR